ncbi:hypothetical protein GCM10009855_01070 [Gordonia cholesterolivorans]|uniref:Uncharacterized protein n=1 Tax=Gordonia cholesterolivorans TaxID=559625 RepID=A0ABN3GZW4_9ACTN
MKMTVNPEMTPDTRRIMPAAPEPSGHDLVRAAAFCIREPAAANLVWLCAAAAVPW